MANDGGRAGRGDPRYMKTITTSILAALAATVLAAAAGRLPDPVPRALRHINDFHGSLESSAGLSLSLADPGAAPRAHRRCACRPVARRRCRAS